MSVREGMLELISELRVFSNAGTADYSIAGAYYWTDEQLQNVLDQRRQEVYNYELSPLERWDSGDLVRREFVCPFKYVERGAYFVVTDQYGNAYAANLYSVDYLLGVVSFNQTVESPVFVNARAYDIYNSAADVLEKRAVAIASTAYSWSSDNMRVDKTKMRSEFLEMASYYRAAAGLNTVGFNRSDT